MTVVKLMTVSNKEKADEYDWGLLLAARMIDRDDQVADLWTKSIMTIGQTPDSANLWDWFIFLYFFNCVCLLVGFAHQREKYMASCIVNG
jgi:hypothetical protein